MRDNLDDDKREQVKESDKIRKKQMSNNLDDKEKEQVKESDKIRRKKCLITVIMIKENR